jgi:WhiB family transcriptional regulator, redox-sensing transcriptional regulator
VEEIRSWMDHAACRGRADLFFPPPGERPQTRVKREERARRLCEQCAVLAPCRMFARRNHEYGYWGGENEEARGDAGFPVADPIGGRARRRRLALEATA